MDSLLSSLSYWSQQYKEISMIFVHWSGSNFAIHLSAPKREREREGRKGRRAMCMCVHIHFCMCVFLRTVNVWVNAVYKQLSSSLSWMALISFFLPQYLSSISFFNISVHVLIAFLRRWPHSSVYSSQLFLGTNWSLRILRSGHTTQVRRELAPLCICIPHPSPLGFLT